MYLTISRVKQSQISLSLAQKRPQKNRFRKNNEKTATSFKELILLPKLTILEQFTFCLFKMPEFRQNPEKQVPDFILGFMCAHARH